MNQQEIIDKLTAARKLVKEVLKNYYDEIQVCIDCQCSESTMRPYMDKRNLCWDIIDNIDNLIDEV